MFIVAGTGYVSLGNNRVCRFRTERIVVVIHWRPGISRQSHNLAHYQILSGVSETVYDKSRRNSWRLRT